MKIGPELEIGLRSIKKDTRATFVFNRDKQCVFINDTALTFLGYEIDDFKNNSILAIVDEGEEGKVIAELEKEISTPYELTVLTKSGGSKIVIASGRNVEYDGKMYRISDIQDITDIKEKEKIVLEQYKNEVLGDLITNISHQWRQKLSFITTILTSIPIKIEMGVYVDKDKDVLNEIKKVECVAQELSKTLDQFKILSTPSSEKTSVSLMDLFLQSYDIVKESSSIKKVSLRTDDNSINNIMVYENELQQVFTILIRNSEDAFMDKSIEKPKICVQLKEENSKHIFSVRDNAGGVKSNIINRIFEPYFTTKHKSQGTGLGLYRAKQIIEEICGGTMQVSNIEKGIEFKIILPI